MGTIAEKLSYLDTTREKILIETNRLGVGLTEQDKFRDYAKGLHDGYIDIINNGTDTLYDNMEKVTGEGSNITLTGVEEAPMQSDINGDTYQFSTTGKNLLSFPYSATTKEENGIIWTVNDNGSITISGTATGISFFQLYDNKNQKLFTDTTKTYTLQIGQKNSNITLSCFDYVNNVVSRMKTDETYAYKYGIAFTPTNNGTGNLFRLAISNGTVITTPITIYPMIVEGDYQTTLLDYEPYTGGIASPNPDYSQPINVVSGRQEVSVVGKNLFDKDNTIYAYINSNSYVVNDNSHTNALSDYILVDQNTNYVFSANTRMNGLNVAFFNSQKQFTSRKMGQLANYNSFDTESNSYIRVWCDFDASTEMTPSVIESKEVQLEKGSTASEYEAFKGQSYEINLGKNLFNFTTYTTDAGGLNSTISGTNWVCNGTATSTSKYITDYIANTFQAGTYTFSITETLPKNLILRFFDANNTTLSSNIITGGNKSITFTLTGNEKKYRLIFNPTTNAEYDINVNLQLEAGSQATTYTPYKTPIELCKIGDYKDRIYKLDHDSKNLFDYNDLVSKIQTFTINGNQNNFTINGVGTYDYLITLIGTHTISGNWSTTNLNGQVRLIYEDDTYVNLFSSYSSTTTSGTINLTTTKNVKAIRFATYGNNNITFTNFMINEGSTALPYEPYGEKGTWWLNKNIGKVVLNGSENWNVYDTTYKRINLLLSNSTTTSTRTMCYSNYFKFSSSSNDVGTCFTYSERIYLYPTLDINTTALFKTWLSTHNTIVYYVLSTPTYTEITDTELITQLNNWYNQKSIEGQTNISVTSGDLPAILNVKALKQYE